MCGGILKGASYRRHGDQRDAQERGNLVQALYLGIVSSQGRNDLADRWCGAIARNVSWMQMHKAVVLAIRRRHDVSTLTQHCAYSDAEDAASETYCISLSAPVM